MRHFITSAALAATVFAASPSAIAQETDIHPVSEVIAEGGLVAAEGFLTARSFLGGDDETAFLLGGVQFLRGIEVMMQTRWDNNAAGFALMPGMRADLPPNPKAKKFDPAFFETALTRGLVQFSKAERQLSRASKQDFAVTVRLTDLWFDVNRDGNPQDFERLTRIMGGMGTDADEGFDGLIRFDSADADWLAAYNHLLSGMSETALAVDPTPSITRVYDARADLEALGPMFIEQTGFAQDDWLDMAVSVLLALKGEPDKARAKKAHSHFKSMIAHNRLFWSEVMEETDNDREWLPNPSQQAAFGMEVTEEVAEGWQDVLAEIEDILDGKALVPYWRVTNGYNPEKGIGLNMKKLFLEPGDMDPLMWIQGEAALPYLEEGKIANMRSWSRFSRMTRGDGLLFSVWFN